MDTRNYRDRLRDLILKEIQKIDLLYLLGIVEF